MKVLHSGSTSTLLSKAQNILQLAKCAAKSHMTHNSFILPRGIAAKRPCGTSHSSWLGQEAIVISRVLYLPSKKQERAIFSQSTVNPSHDSISGDCHGQRALQHDQSYENERSPARVQSILLMLQSWVIAMPREPCSMINPTNTAQTAGADCKYLSHAT